MNSLLTMAAGVVPAKDRSVAQRRLPQNPVRVLLVEDNLELRACIQEALEMWGFEVDAFSDGQKAVEAAYRKSYSVLLTDLRLPGMSGIGVLRSVRSFNPSLQALVMTAYPDWKVADEARDAGAAFVLHKPLNLKDLSEIVTQLGAHPCGKAEQRLIPENE